MRRSLNLFFVLIFAISSFAQVKHSNYYYKRKALFEKTPNTKDEIIFLGNSITEGGDWSMLFPNYNVINRGISGDVTDGILLRIDEITSSQPIKVFLLIGTNDLAKGQSVDYIFNKINLIIQNIRTNSSSTKIFIQSILPINPLVGDNFKGHKSKKREILQLNKKLKKLSRANKIKFINLHKKFRNSKGHLIPSITKDGLHLNSKGYKLWKKQISKYVK